MFFKISSTTLYALVHLIKPILDGLTDLEPAQKRGFRSFDRRFRAIEHQTSHFILDCRKKEEVTGRQVWTISWRIRTVRYVAVKQLSECYGQRGMMTSLYWWRICATVPMLPTTIHTPVDIFVGVNSVLHIATDAILMRCEINTWAHTLRWTDFYIKQFG